MKRIVRFFQRIHLCWKYPLYYWDSKNPNYFTNRKGDVIGKIVSINPGGEKMELTDMHYQIIELTQTKSYRRSELISLGFDSDMIDDLSANALIGHIWAGMEWSYCRSFKGTKALNERK